MTLQPACLPSSCRHTGACGPLPSDTRPRLGEHSGTARRTAHALPLNSRPIPITGGPRSLHSTSASLCALSCASRSRGGWQGARDTTPLRVASPRAGAVLCAGGHAVGRALMPMEVRGQAGRQGRRRVRGRTVLWSGRALGLGRAHRADRRVLDRPSGAATILACTRDGGLDSSTGACRGLRGSF